MATYTPNYNLSKPEGADDFADFRETYNDNMDIIDANLGGGGGGGGTSVKYTADVLYDQNTNNVTINLSHPITDYDQIFLIGYAPADGTDYRKSAVYDVSFVESFIGTTTKFGVTGDAWYCWYTFDDASTMTRTGNFTIWLRTVIGVKYGDTRGSVYSSEVLATGGGNVPTVSLTYPITDYDQIILVGRSTADSTEYRMCTLYDKAFIEQYVGTATRFGVTSDAWYTWYTFSDASTLNQYNTNNLWVETVIGIKYSNSAYHADTLLADSPNTSPLVLAQSITDYKQILLIGRSQSGGEYRITTLYDSEYIQQLVGTSIKVGVTGDAWGTWYMFATANMMNRFNSIGMWIFSVIGIRFGDKEGEKWVSSASMEIPNSKNVNATFNCPSNGFLHIEMSLNASGGHWRFNSSSGRKYWLQGSASEYISADFPVYKGEILTVNAVSNLEVASVAKFIALA